MTNVHCGHKNSKQNSSNSSTFNEPNLRNDTSIERYSNILLKSSEIHHLNSSN